MRGKGIQKVAMKRGVFFWIPFPSRPDKVRDARPGMTIHSEGSVHLSPSAYTFPSMLPKKIVPSGATMGEERIAPTSIILFVPVTMAS
jgi:hypothetical protein